MSPLPRTEGDGPQGRDHFLSVGVLPGAGHHAKASIAQLILLEARVIVHGRMNLALFDFDGTLTFGDTYTPFLRYSGTPLRLAVGRIALAPVVVACRLGLISESRARVVASAFAFRGRGDAEVRLAGARYARDVLPGVIRPEALERIEWHKAQGDVVVVVSASLDVYLAEWCRRYGVDVICSELDVRDGRLTGHYRGGDCVGQEKARRIVDRYDLPSFLIVYAYGDTEDDRAMLSLATTKYFRGQELPG
jgi:phosphatidylglycerophosphatase C